MPNNLYQKRISSVSIRTFKSARAPYQNQSRKALPIGISFYLLYSAMREYTTKIDYLVHVKALGTHTNSWGRRCGAHIRVIGNGRA